MEANCEGCESQPEFVAPWISHLLSLDALIQAGCRFALDDLDVGEWDGLKLLAQERNRYDRKRLKDIEGK